MRHSKLKDFTKETARLAGQKSKRPVSIKTALKRRLQNGTITPDDVADAIIKFSTKGNAAYGKLLIEYIDGKVTDKMEMTGPDGQPLKTCVEVKFTKP